MLIFTYIVLKYNSKVYNWKVSDSLIHKFQESLKIELLVWKNKSISSKLYAGIISFLAPIMLIRFQTHMIF